MFIAFLIVVLSATNRVVLCIYDNNTSQVIVRPPKGIWSAEEGLFVLSARLGYRLGVGCTPARTGVYVTVNKMMNRTVVGQAIRTYSDEKDSILASDWSPFMNDEAEFGIERVSFSHEGLYRCSAVYPSTGNGTENIEHYSKFFRIEVWGFEILEAVEAVEGQQFNLTCRGRRKHEPLRLYWAHRRTGGPSRFSEMDIDQEVVIESKATYADYGEFSTWTLSWESLPTTASGEYSCGLGSIYSTDSVRTNLVVLDKQKRNKNFLVEAGSAFYLDCSSRLENTTWRWKPLRLLNSTLNVVNLTFEMDYNLRRSLRAFVNEHLQQYVFNWGAIPETASGLYECHSNNYSVKNVESFNVTVQSPTKPVILQNEREEVITAGKRSRLVLRCDEKGSLPVPKVQWFAMRQGSNGDSQPLTYPLTADNFLTMKTGKSWSELVVQLDSESVSYKCVFKNRLGTDEKTIRIKIRPLEPWAVASIVIGVLVFITFTAFAGWKVYVALRKYRALLNSRLKLLEGNADQINPDIPIDEQAGLLPYDSKWEFPIERLFLGMQLGTGHYGRVFEARAQGIGGMETVAVKMVKSKSDMRALSSLASEIKILAYVGTHSNIVGLLGAVTKNLIKGELMLMVEYCSNGNLRDFLRKNRARIVEPSEPLSKENIMTVPPPESPKVNEQRLFTTDQLIEWSHHISKGLGYLTGKKIIHGDLAARNVLLTDDYVAKIADFGLARKLMNNDNYLKEGHEALPVKWMAIESLEDRVFSPQSDVWSYGVTLWEIFSLGQEPYPGVEGFEDLLNFLRNGHRLDRPINAPDLISDIMTCCWKEKPEERLSFRAIEELTFKLLDPQIRSKNHGDYDRFGYITFGKKNDKKEDCDTSMVIGYLELLREDTIGNGYLLRSRVSTKASNDDNTDELRRHSNSENKPHLSYGYETQCYVNERSTVVGYLGLLRDDNNMVSGYLPRSRVSIRVSDAHINDLDIHPRHPNSDTNPYLSNDEYEVQCDENSEIIYCTRL